MENNKHTNSNWWDLQIEDIKELEDNIQKRIKVLEGEVDFCSCGNPSGGHYSDENIIGCLDCGQRIK